MTGDVIELRGLRLVGRHGCLDEEKGRDQPFEVDLDVETSFAAAAVSDDLDDAVDYGRLVDAVAAVVSGERFDLLERLAERIAEVVLDDARVTSVTVALRKLRPPVPYDLATAGVRITRRRP